MAGEIGERAVGLRVDVTRQDELEAARDLALDRFGRIDLVMNNVGVIVMGGVEEIPLDAWQRAIDINLLGVVRSNLVFLPHLIAQGSGYVVNTASTLGLIPYSYDRTPYMATKHAVVGLSEGMYLALGPKGVQVSCLCPAGVLTNIVEQITVHGTIAPPRAPTLTAVASPRRWASSSPTGWRPVASSSSPHPRPPTSWPPTAPTWTATSPAWPRELAEPTRERRGSGRSGRRARARWPRGIRDPTAGRARGGCPRPTRSTR